MANNSASLRDALLAVRDKSRREIERLEKNEQSAPKKKKKKTKKKKEKRGVGRPPASGSVDEARIKLLRQKLEAVSDPKVKKRLSDEIARLREGD